MIHIAVIIITYRRNQGLVQLLTELGRQQCHDTTRLFRLTTIIVDNDSAGSATASVEPFKLVSKLNIRYIIEPTLGIPLARNAGIAAVPDDDEWPSRSWINELLKTQLFTGAVCVYGAVIPVYQEEVSTWLVKNRIFNSRQLTNQASLKIATSGNVLISTVLIAWIGIDQRKLFFNGSSAMLDTAIQMIILLIFK